MTKTELRKQMELEAIKCLSLARSMRETHRNLIAVGVSNYGWQGATISGVEQDHWPKDTKDQLRKNARDIGDLMGKAARLWHQAGKRMHTFRRLAEQYRVDGIRY